MVKRLVGIDIGSRYVKIVNLENDKIKKHLIIDTSTFYRNYCNNEDGKIIIKYQKLDIGEFDKMVSTGYGRNNVNIKNSCIIQELKAHYLGAMWQTKIEDFVILDVGGQDTKVIKVKNGKMVDLALNDKCAASCGRYLENMVNVLGISIEELAKHYKNPVTINSTCAIFSESEIIGYISEGIAIEKLAAGVNYSLYNRLIPLINKYDEKVLVVTGGVAQNKAFINILKNESTFENIIVPEYPIINGAIGCCVYGMNFN